MPARRVFALLWRINALIILVVGILAAAVLTMVAYYLLADLMSPRHLENVSHVASDDVHEQLSQLDEFEQVAGTDLLRARQRVRQSYPPGTIRSGGSKEAWSTRNYLYLDPNTRSSHWLVPGMDGLFLESYPLPRSDGDKQQAKARAFVHVSVARDTSGDQHLSESDSQTIAISDPDGRNYRVVVGKAEKLHTAQLLDDERLLIVYTEGGKLMAVEPRLNKNSTTLNAYEVRPQQLPASPNTATSQP